MDWLSPFRSPALALSISEESATSLPLLDPIPTFELAAVDAIRALEDGESLEAIITAVGALEAALDLYFSRAWRLAQPRVYPSTAVTLLRVHLRRGKKVYTVEDVLEAGGIRAKVMAYATATAREDEFQDLYDAIELRNLAVHSGVRVPVDKARLHVERMAKFVLDDIVPKIETEYPILPRAELLYACEESLGNNCAPELEEIVATYLTGRGLTAKLFNQRYKRKQMYSERFGESLVIRVTFDDFGPDAINLFIARSLLFHYLERRDDIARARADYDPSPSVVSRRPFFEVVATGMTHVVWSAAIDRATFEIWL